MLSNNEIAVLLTAKDQLSGVLRNAEKQVHSFGDAGTQASRNLQSFDAGLLQVSRIGMTAFAGGAVLSAKAFMDWESSFAGVRKTVDGTPEELNAIADSFRNMAKEMPTSVNELNRIGEAAGQLGVKKENIIGFAKVMADLGVTTDMSSDMAATALAQLANVTQMPQENFDRLGATVVALGNAGASTESQIVSMGLRIAGAGAQVGLSEDQILAFASALSSVGIEAEAGGSAFSRVMVDMAQAAAEGGDKLEDFAQVAGMSATEFKQKFETDAAGAIVAFVNGLGRIKDEGGNVFGVLENLELGEIRVRDALLRSAGAGDLMAQSLKTGATAWQENTALVEEANKRYGTTASRLEIARNKALDAAVTFGNDLAPAVLGASEAGVAMIDAFTALPDSTQNLILLGGAVAVATPQMLKLGETAVSAGKAVMHFSELSGKAKIAIGTGGLLTAVVGLDLALQSLTGEGLVGTVKGFMEGTTESERFGKATEKVRIELEKLQGLTVGDQFAVLANDLQKAADVFNEETVENLRKWGGEYKDLDASSLALAQSLPQMNTALSESIVRLAELGDSGNKTGREMQAALNEAQSAAFGFGSGMAQLGTSSADLYREMMKLPEPMQAAFAAGSGLTAQQEALARAMEATNATFDVGIEDIKRLARAHAEVGVAVEAQAQTTTAAKAWFDAVAGGAKDAEEAVKLTKKAIDELTGAFSDSNPAAVAARAAYAALTEELDDLKAKGDDLTAAERTRVDVIENQLLPALEAEVGQYDSNQKAMEGQAQAIQSLIGETGYGSLLQAMSDAKVAAEDQTFVQGELSNAYYKMTHNDLPGAITKFQELRDKLSPEIWRPIAEQLGPTLINAIRNGVSNPAEQDRLIKAVENLVGGALKAGESATNGAALIGEMIAKGVVSGMAASLYLVDAEARRMIDAAHSAAMDAAAMRSPSRLFADTVGRYIAEGVALGIREAAPTVSTAIREELAMWHGILENGLADAESMSTAQLAQMMTSLNAIVNTSGLPAELQTLANNALSAFTQSIATGAGVANTEIMEFIGGLLDTIAAGTALVSTKIAEIPTMPGGGTGTGGITFPDGLAGVPRIPGMEGGYVVDLDEVPGYDPDSHTLPGVPGYDWVWTIKGWTLVPNKAGVEGYVDGSGKPVEGAVSDYWEWDPKTGAYVFKNPVTPFTPGHAYGAGMPGLSTPPAGFKWGVGEGGGFVLVPDPATATGVPSYDVGLTRATSDHLAFIHEGEGVLTKEENAARLSGGRGGVVVQQLVVNAPGFYGDLTELARRLKIEFESVGISMEADF